MEEVLTWPGRTYPAVVILVLGLGLVVAGFREATAARKPTTWPDWAMLYLVAFRRTVVGLCVATAGAAWLSDIRWLLAVSICVGIGELLESSYYIGVLRWGARTRSVPSLSR